MSEVVERVARRAAPVVVALLAVLAAVLGERSAAVGVAAVAGIAAVAVVLAAVPVQGWPLAGGCVVVLAGFTVLAGGGASNVGWFGVCVLAAWCAFAAGVAQALVFLAVAAAGFVVQLGVVSPDSGWAAWIAGTTLTTLACLLAAQQRVLLAQLREAQAGLADRTRAEERTRVARELHDVIGHALTVTLLHLGTARLALADEPETARASLEEAERQARRSLEDIRASVGLLRDDSPTTTPLPGGADLAELVDTFRRTGTPVTWRVEGDPAALAPTTGLAAYRIAQEALTNAARHAPGAATDVCLRVAGGEAHLVVDSAGAPGRRTTARAGEPPGAGLVGMRERAAAVGGRVDAGPSGTGWRVEAVLPA